MSVNKKNLSNQEYLKYYYDVPHSGSTSAGKPLRRMKNVICPYRGVEIIPSSAIKDFEKKLAKTKTAAETLHLLSFYKKHFLPTEASMFSIFKNFVETNPDDNLQNCLQMIRTNSLTKLKLEQLEVLDKVDILTYKLCSRTALEVRERTTKCRQLILSDNERMFFKRKIFLNSLENISSKENEKEIISEIRNKALFLPTSESSKNAFIVKYSKRTQSEIARRLFIASTGTIEHIIPASMGGANSIGNFLLTSASGNRYRENMLLTEYIKRHPNIPQYVQKYINCVINEIHNGYLQGIETYPYKIKQKLFEESNGRILISLSSYKYSENEALELVKEHENQWQKYLR